MSAAMHTLWGWQDGPTGHTARGPSVLVASACAGTLRFCDNTRAPSMYFAISKIGELTS